MFGSKLLSNWSYPLPYLYLLKLKFRTTLANFLSYVIFSFQKMMEKEFLWTFVVQCSLCFSDSYQMAGSYDLKNKNVYALWNCIDTLASRLVLLEKTQSTVYVLWMFLVKNHNRKIRGWCLVYTGTHDRSL